jgi:AraC-like DNA-binding protein
MYQERIMPKADLKHKPSEVSCNLAGFKQSIFFANYDLHPLHPPLRIFFAGSSIWTKNNFYQRSCSDLFAVELVTAGNACFSQDGREYQVEPGEVFLIRRGTANVYKTGPLGFLHKRFMCIDGPFLEPLLTITELNKCDVVKPRSVMGIRRLHKEAQRILRERPVDFAERISLVAYAVLLELSAARQKDVFPGRIMAAINLIHGNITRLFSNREMADCAGISVPHFNRLFKHHVHMAPCEYMVRERMKYAARQLIMTSLSIKEIAAVLHYENPFSLSQQFSKEFGESPRAYRRNHGHPSH